MSCFLCLAAGDLPRGAKPLTAEYNLTIIDSKQRQHIRDTPKEGVDKNRLITLRLEYSGGAGAVYRGIGPGTEAAVVLIKTDEGWLVMNWAEIGG